MNNSFDHCDELGRKGEFLIAAALRKVFCTVDDVPKEINQQLKDADIICRGLEQMAIPNIRVEVKTELRHTGNLFWETYSNKSTGRLGWGLTSKADVLYFLFWADAIGYRIDDLQSKIWAFDYSKKNYPEVQQKKYAQTNDTWGRLVPVDASWLKAQRFSFEAAKRHIEQRFTGLAA